MDNRSDFTILIIEDQPFIAMTAEDVARGIGASVVGSATRVSDALALIETTPWDMALLDVTLADGQMSYPVAERLQAKGIAFAFLTAWDAELDTPYRYVPVLRKPFRLTELESCLQALVGRALKPTERRAA